MNNKLIPKTKEELFSAINEFKKYESVKDYYKIRTKFYELFGLFPFTVDFKQKELLKHIPLYRARPANQVLELGKTNIKSYMSPPIFHKLGYNGRANWNGRNVFYAGDSPYVTIVENKDIEIDKEYYIGQWEFDVEKITEHEVPISYLFHDGLPEENPWRKVIPTKNEQIQKLVEKDKFRQEVAELFVEFVNELSVLFTENNTEYNLSAFISDNILFSKNKESFIPKLLIYPSVESEKNRCNIAINPDFADKYLRLVKLVKMRISEFSDEGFKAIYNEIGQIEKEKVQFYHFNFDKSKALYKIDSFECGCGYKFRFENPEEIKLQVGDEQLNLRQLVESESKKWVTENLLLDYSEEVFSKKGIGYKKVLKMTIPLPKASIKRGGKTHTGLTCLITIEQPLDYIKEGDIRFGMKPLVNTKNTFYNKKTDL